MTINRVKKKPKQPKGTLPTVSDLPSIQKVKLIKTKKLTKEEVAANEIVSDAIQPALPSENTEPTYSRKELDEVLKSEGIPTADERVTDPEQVDFRRRQILRLLLRGVPQLTITEYLRIPKALLSKEIVAIKSSIRKQIQDMDVPLFVGMTLEFFDEARNIALRLATDTTEKSNLVKMRALEVALKAENDKHVYLQRIGLYKNAPPLTLGQPPDSIASDADDLLLLIELASQVVVEKEVVEVGL